MRQSSFSQLNINFTVTGLSCVCKIVLSNELTVQNTCRKENYEVEAAKTLVYLRSLVFLRFIAILYAFDTYLFVIL